MNAYALLHRLSNLDCVLPQHACRKLACYIARKHYLVHVTSALVQPTLDAAEAFIAGTIKRDDMALVFEEAYRTWKDGSFAIDANYRVMHCAFSWSVDVNEPMVMRFAFAGTQDISPPEISRFFGDDVAICLAEAKLYHLSVNYHPTPHGENYRR